jgi:hypothetical protein
MQSPLKSVSAKPLPQCFLAPIQQCPDLPERTREKPFDTTSAALFGQPFRPLSRQQFTELVSSFTWTRRIWRIDMHHTWFPTHDSFDDVAAIERMDRYHRDQRGFDCIAQHVSIAPDGTIWTGRDWNKTPASVGFGMNEGVFMFETVGNFDHGHDRLVGEQLTSVIAVIETVQARFRLPVQALLFHHEVPQTEKTCPGSAVEKGDILKLVATARTSRRDRALAAA